MLCNVGLKSYLFSIFIVFVGNFIYVYNHKVLRSELELKGRLLDEKEESLVVEKTAIKLQIKETEKLEADVKQSSTRHFTEVQKWMEEVSQQQTKLLKRLA